MIRVLALAAALTLLPVAIVGAATIHDATLAGDLEAVKQLVEGTPELVAAPDSIQNLPLHLAAGEGHVEIISYLLAKGAEIDAGDRENTTSLGLAALHGKLEAARLLVAQGAAVTARDNNGMTPLLFSVQGGDLAVMEHLLAHGALLTDVSSSNSNALHQACRGGHQEMVSRLLDLDFDIHAQNGRGYTPIYCASYRGHEDLIRFLAAKGALIDRPDNDGITPLCAAGYTGETGSAGVLIELGADVNHAPNTHGHSPLAAAVWFGHTETARFLMDHGADVQYRRGNGETLLHAASQRGHQEMASLLLERGLDIDVTDNFGGTPLGNAVFGQPEMVRWLIARGAAVDQVTDTGMAPLVHAIYGGDTTIVSALLESGARTNCRHRGEEVPLLAAISRGQAEVTEMLINAGADLSAKDGRTGQTALHAATLTGRSELVRLVLNHRAELETQDDAGRTALAYAIGYGHKSCAELLKARGANAAGLAENYGAPAQLRQAPAAGSASVWYLGHSGWAVRTHDHLLIFDYFQAEPLPDVPCLRNGFVDGAEIADLQVTVLSSHEHGDHYDTAMFAWREQVPSVRYILGHEPADQTGYTFIPPRESRDFDGLKVSTIHSTDAGVGYIVEVDGLVIFHAGDHAAGSVELPEAYTAEIEYIAQGWPRIDMAFLPISGCSLGTPESVKAGVIHALQKLQPRTYYPQHVMGSEYRIAEFAQEIEALGIAVPARCAQHRGDMFQYSQDKDI